MINQCRLTKKKQCMLWYYSTKTSLPLLPFLCSHCFFFLFVQNASAKGFFILTTSAGCATKLVRNGRKLRL